MVGQQGCRRLEDSDLTLDYAIMLVFLVMLIKANFPVNERVAAGTSYKEMLAESSAPSVLS